MLRACQILKSSVSRLTWALAIRGGNRRCDFPNEENRGSDAFTWHSSSPPTVVDENCHLHHHHQQGNFQSFRCTSSFGEVESEVMTILVNTTSRPPGSVESPSFCCFPIHPSTVSLPIPLPLIPFYTCLYIACPDLRSLSLFVSLRLPFIPPLLQGITQATP